MEKLKVRKFIGAVIVLASLSACNPEKPTPVARSFNQFLYPEDLHGVVPPGVTGDDSTQLVRAYMEQWVQQQALLHHARRNVDINTEHLDKQVETYKNGLIVYAYEQELVNQKLDTVVTDSEIQQYYDEQPELFVLQQPIFKRSYIRLRTDAPELERVKRLMVSPNFEEQDLLTKYCSKYASEYALLDTSWHYLDDLANEIPLSQIDEANYGQTGRIFEIIENNELYLIILHDSKLREARSPLPLVRDQVRNLILNKRKIDLIDRMQRSIVADAREKNNIEIYN